MYDLERKIAVREPIRPRGIDKGFEKRKTLSDIQEKCDKLYEKKCRKKRDVFSEKEKQKKITRLRHRRNSYNNKIYNEDACSMCEIFDDDICDTCDCCKCSNGIE